MFRKSWDFSSALFKQEIAEPLSDLKEGIAALQDSKTFKYILSVLLSIGNFLNGAQVSSSNSTL